jgi:hypothetical protein
MDAERLNSGCAADQGEVVSASGRSSLYCCPVVVARPAYDVAETGMRHTGIRERIA